MKRHNKASVARYLAGARNLVELESRINGLAELSNAGQDLYDLVDWADLPTFGTRHDLETSEVWSYDDDNVLVTCGAGDDSVEIKPRCAQCGQASFHCSCEEAE